MTTVDEIRALFEAAEFDVTEEVGAVEGQVDRFATQRSAMMSPRIWWVLVDRFPDDLGVALGELDLARDVHGADRALAIVVGGVTPVGYQPDLVSGISNYVTLRYLMLFLGGVFDDASAPLRQAVESVDPLPTVETEDGRVMNVSDCVEQWIARGDRAGLMLTGVDAEEVLRDVARRRAQLVVRQPETALPMLLHIGDVVSKVRSMLIDRGWAINAIILQDKDSVALSRGATAETYLRVHVAEPSVEDLTLWFQMAVSSQAAEQLRGWLRKDPDAVKLLCRRNVRKALVRAAQQETTHVDDANWLLKTLSRTFAIMARPLGRMYAVVHELEQAALRMFALGEEAEIDFKGLPIEGLDRNLALVVKVRRTKNPRTSYAFPCRTVRDWFIARMLAHGGERDLLTRYNFPQEYVLQFLAVIAPDVAALATADRAEELRHEIESQVERQVQLTLGHQLNRSVGALLSNLRSVDRALGAAQVDDNARIAMERIREELAHLRRLTDRSRMLYESSAWDLASLALARFVHDVVLPLREQHARVEVTVDVAPELHVRAADEGLREILHCLIENACHSVCGRAADLPARVEVRGQRLGETVEVRVTDNGLGVSKEHQERIFEPFVTTKKGGAGGLRGTGLGLSIARRFATRMGARVTLESSNGTTTFVATFVAGEPT